MTKRTAKEATVEWTVRQGAASVVTAFASIPNRVVQGLVLGPAGLGVLAVADLATTYAGYSDLGVPHALTRQVPLAHGEARRGEVEELRRTAHAWTWFSGIAGGFALWILYFGGVQLWGLLTVANLGFLSATIALDRLNTYLHCLAKGHGEFAVIGRNVLRVSMLTPLLLLPAVYFWHITGVLAARCLLQLFTLFFYVRQMAPRRRLFGPLTLSFPRLRELLHIGVYLRLISLMGMIYRTIDTTLLVLLTTAAEVGIFAFALGLLAFTINLCAPFGAVAYRKMLVESTAGEPGADRVRLRRFLEAPLTSYLLIVSMMLGVTFFGYAAIVRVFLPQFEAALPVALVVILGHMFFATTHVTGSVLNVDGLFGRRLMLICSGLVVNTVLDVWLLSRGWGVLGVAWGSTISYALYAPVLLGASAKLVYGSAQRVLPLFVRMTLASILLTASIYFLHEWRPAPMTQPGIVARAAVEFGLAGVKAGIYAAVVLAAYGVLFRHHRVVPEVMSSLRHAARFAFLR